MGGEEDNEFVLFDILQCNGTHLKSYTDVGNYHKL